MVQIIQEGGFWFAFGDLLVPHEHQRCSLPKVLVLSRQVFFLSGLSYFSSFHDAVASDSHSSMYWKPQSVKPVSLWCLATFLTRTKCAPAVQPSRFRRRRAAVWSEISRTKRAGWIRCLSWSPSFRTSELCGHGHEEPNGARSAPSCDAFAPCWVWDTGFDEFPSLFCLVSRSDAR
jgi:hypothetical protein